MKTKPLNEIDYSVMNHLKELRKVAGKTRQEISNDLNGEITVEQLKSYELSSRYSEPPYRHLIALAKYYNVTTDYLLGVSEQRETTSSVLDAKVKEFISTLTDEELEAFNTLLEPHMSMSNNDEQQGSEIMNPSLIDSIFDIFAVALNNSVFIRKMPKVLTNSIRKALDTNDYKDVASFLSDAKDLSNEINKARRAMTYDMVRDLDGIMEKLLPEQSLVDLIEKETLNKATSILEEHKADLETKEE